MEFRELTITPTMAKAMLEKNTSNRKISDTTVEAYVSDMINGRWKSNTAETIKISSNGRILDGQHRLEAVIRSEKTIKFTVAYGVDEGVFDVLDTGKIRSSADVFSIQSIDNSTSASAIIKGYLISKKGNSTNVSSKSSKITNTVILNEYQSRPEFWKETVAFCMKSYKNFSQVLPVSNIGTIYSVLYDISPMEARDFINQMCTGEDITNSSISVLRKTLIKDRLSIRKMNQSDKFSMIIRTWNAYRTNKTYKLLKIEVTNNTIAKPI